jgi:SSS family solute:Na+ symporter/sodium/proline symporter
MATQVSAGTLVGAIGVHYAIGVSFVFAWVGIWFGWLFSARYVAPQLRSFGGVTIPEFLGERLDAGADGDRIQGLAALLVAGIYLVFTSAQYVAGSVVLETTFGVRPVFGMAVLAVVALLYTTAGGMRASVLTDLLLAVFLIGGLIVATIVGLQRLGGFAGVQTEVLSTDPSLLNLNVTSVDIVGFALAFGLSLSVAPYEVSRVYAMRDQATVRLAIGGSLALQAVVACCVAILGLIARVEFPGLTNPDAAVVRLVTAYFGPVVGILLLLGVVAAVVSTVDSILLVSSSAIAYDLYESVIVADEESGRSACTTDSLSNELARWPTAVRKRIGSLTTDSNTQTHRVARLATVASALLPLGLALNSDLFGGIVQLIVVLYAALVAGALFVPVVLGIHWSGLTGEGALAGMAVGTIAVFGWHLWVATTLLSGPATAVPPVVVGVASSFVATIGVSIRT